MLESEVRRLLTTPVNVPFYRTRASAPHVRDTTRFDYFTDYEAARKLLPEPLQLDDVPKASIVFTQYQDIFADAPLIEVSQVIHAHLDGVSYDYVSAVYSDSMLTLLINRALFIQPILPGNPSIAHVDGTTRMDLSVGGDEVIHTTSVYKCEPMDAADAVTAAERPKVFLDVLSMAFRLEPSRQSLVAVAPEQVRVREAYVSPYRMRFADHIMAPVEDLPVRQRLSAVRTIAEITPGGAATLFSY